MALNSGNMYSIPEHPAEEDINEESYSKEPLSVKETNDSQATKKVSSTSLPEKPFKFPKNEINCNNRSIPTLITSETEIQTDEIVTSSTIFQRDINRLSVSLIDISDFGLASDSGTFNVDKESIFANMASSHMISVNNSNSYLEVKDCISHSNQEQGYETLLSSSDAHNGSSNSKSIAVKISHDCCNKERKNSDNLVIIDLNKDAAQFQTTEDLNGPSILRPRSRSMQWIQNTFQNVSNKYKFLLEFRRPSDIAEERMRKSKEELEMDEPEYEVPTAIPCPAPRRFSENIIGKQKRFPFTARLGQLRDFWRDRNLVPRRQEEKDIDQTRTDVCPLFSFPRKRDEDELILDALRQAMRKCTAVDPSSRPTSSTVLDQLSTLLD